MRMIGAMLLLLGLLGCSGVSYVGHPLSDGTYKVQRNMITTHWLDPSPQTVWVEICKHQVTIPYDWRGGPWHLGTDYIDYQDCAPISTDRKE